MPLFIVSTPIGNSEDITLRAIKILTSSSVILSENTRTTNNLLQMHGILGKKLINFTDHTEEKFFLQFLELAKTQNVCLVSEAGTPIIADPGYKIIKKAFEIGVQVSPISGASSLTSAISVSGLPFYNFVFLSFYEKHKIPKIKQLLELELSIACFVPARDIAKTLEELKADFSNHNICIARELTKIYEDIKTGRIETLLEYYKDASKLKGEAVLMISPKSDSEVKHDISFLLDEVFKEKPFLKEIKQRELVEILKIYEKPFKAFAKKEIYNALVKLTINLEV